MKHLTFGQYRSDIRLKTKGVRVMRYNKPLPQNYVEIFKKALSRVYIR